MCAMNEGGSEGANGVLIEGAPERMGAPRRGGGSKINWWRLVQGFLHFFGRF